MAAMFEPLLTKMKPTTYQYQYFEPVAKPKLILRQLVKSIIYVSIDSTKMFLTRLTFHGFLRGSCT